MESDSDLSSLSEDTSVTVKAEGLWFEDGNVVLQADNTVFKVFRGILIRESDVFDGMFSLPQPPVQGHGQDIYEGCQLVKMHDNKDDLEHFLCALFDFEYWNNIERCSVYAAILRMATKYQADTVRKRVLRILKSVYPDTIRAWDAVIKAGDLFPTEHPLHKVWLDDEEDHVAVINAARDTDALILLPAAMLRIYQTGISNVVKGEFSHQLDAVNRDAILAALPELAKLSRQHSFSPLYSDRLTMSPDCRHSMAMCSLNQRRLLSWLEKPRLGYTIDPFFLPTSVWSSPNGAWEFCNACLTFFKEANELGRSAAWQKLPQAFGLPPWGEMRAAAERGADKEMS